MERDFKGVWIPNPKEIWNKNDLGRTNYEI